MIRRLNPYYAARQVETVLPGAKNSVINWLDLRHEPMPSAFRGAVSHRAAKDIAQANLEEAISDRRTLSLGVVTLVLFLITVAFMFFGPALGHAAVAPFGLDDGNLVAHRQARRGQRQRGRGPGRFRGS